MKAAYDIVVSSAESIGAFNAGFDNVNLHGPTTVPSKLATEVHRTELH